MQRILIFILLLVTIKSVAQEDTKQRKLYIETSGGYAFPLVNDELGSTNDFIGLTDRLIRSDSSISIQPVQGTQGPGWQFNFMIGYMFHPNIGVELQGTYTRSNRFVLASNQTPTFQAEHTIVGQRLDIIPQIVFSFPIKKWSIYSKSGLILPVWGKSSSEINIDDQEGSIVEDVLGFANTGSHANLRVKAETFGKFSYGFQTRLGASYEIFDWLHTFAEVRFAALSIRAKNDRIEELDISIYDPATPSNAFVITEEDVSVMDRETVYVSELTESSNNPEVNPNADTSKPLDALDKKDNFNHLAVSIGFRFYIK